MAPVHPVTTATATATATDTATAANAKDKAPGAWIVLKFGGTSVSTPLRWKCICDQVQTHLASIDATNGQYHRVWITISAMTQVTNKLQMAIQQAISPQTNHLETLRAIILQHFALAFEVGLFPSSQTQEVSSLEQHDLWRDKWLKSVIQAQSFSHEPIDPLIPNCLHPLLEEFKHLIRIMEGIKLTEEASPRIRARVLAFGELLSTHLGVCIMKQYGIDDVQRVDAREILKSDSLRAKSDDSKFLQADVLPKTDVQLCERVAQGRRVVLTQGFIASTNDGSTCVLGRGGSDTSGSLFAAMLDAAKYEIWTDVHGMFTSDPRYVPDARLVKCLDYREAQELAAMGAKVLHPRCIIPAQWARIPLEIRNTNDPEGEKTVIRPSDNESGSPKILAVVRREGVTTMSITSFEMCGASGFLSKVFSPFERFGISVDLIATSQFSVTMTLDHIPGGVNGTAFQSLLNELKDNHTTVQVFESCTVVSIVGRKLRKSLAELGQVFEMLGGYDILLLSESAEDLNLSFVVEQQNADAVVANMHRFFFGASSNGSSPRKDSKDTTRPPPLVITDIHREQTSATSSSTMVSMRRSPSREALFGPTWHSLLQHAASNQQ